MLGLLLTLVQKFALVFDQLDKLSLSKNTILFQKTKCSVANAEEGSAYECNDCGYYETSVFERG